MIELARASFAAGFAIALLVAGAIAILGALLTAALVSPGETAPARLPREDRSPLPEMVDWLRKMPPGLLYPYRRR
jgi:hypothetical protein